MSACQGLSDTSETSCNGGSQSLSYRTQDCWVIQETKSGSWGSFCTLSLGASPLAPPWSALLMESSDTQTPPSALLWLSLRTAARRSMLTFFSAAQGEGLRVVRSSPFLGQWAYSRCSACVTVTSLCVLLLFRVFWGYILLKLRIFRGKIRTLRDSSRESQTPMELFELATRSSKARSSKRTSVPSGMRCMR